MGYDASNETGQEAEAEKGSGETGNGGRAEATETGSGETRPAEVAVAGGGRRCSMFLCRLDSPCKGTRGIEASTRRKVKPGDNLSFPGTLPAISRVLSNFPPTPFLMCKLNFHLRNPILHPGFFFNFFGYSGGFVDEGVREKGFIGTG